MLDIRHAAGVGVSSCSMPKGVLLATPFRIPRAQRSRRNDPALATCAPTGAISCACARHSSFRDSSSLLQREAMGAPRISQDTRVFETGGSIWIETWTLLHFVTSGPSRRHT